MNSKIGNISDSEKYMTSEDDLDYFDFEIPFDEWISITDGDEYEFYEEYE